MAGQAVGPWLWAAGPSVCTGDPDPGVPKESRASFRVSCTWASSFQNAHLNYLCKILLGKVYLYIYIFFFFLNEIIL